MLIGYLISIFALPAVSSIVSTFSDKPFIKKRANTILIALSTLTFIATMLFIYKLIILKAKVNITLPYLFHGIKYSFSTSKYGLMFLGTVATLYPLSIIYSIEYYKSQKKNYPRKLYSFLHIAILCAFAISLSNNLITSFIFYEIITITTYPLVINPLSKQSRKVGQRYLMYLIGLSMLFTVPSLIILREVGGSLTFSPIGILSYTTMSQMQINIIFFAFIFGIAKTAIFPIGGWLLKAMIAPPPISAIIHAVIVVKSGLFIVMQAINGVFGVELLSSQIYEINSINLLSIIALITIFTATINAISATHLKTRLAYSTIAQSGYIMLMFSLFSPAGTRAGMMHFVAHSITKITLFFSVGCVYIVQQNYNLKNINSAWKKSPAISFAISLGCLSLLGLPPTIGFQSKYGIITALLEDRAYNLIFYIIIATLLSSYYIFDIVYNFLFMPKTVESKSRSNNIKLSRGIIFVISILCCIIIFGTYFMNQTLYSGL